MGIYIYIVNILSGIQKSVCLFYINHIFKKQNTFFVF